MFRILTQSPTGVLISYHTTAASAARKVEQPPAALAAIRDVATFRSGDGAVTYHVQKLEDE